MIRIFCSLKFLSNPIPLSSRYSSFFSLRRIGYGRRWCSTKLKRSDLNAKSDSSSSNDKLRHQFEDLVLTIERLHHAKLSESSNAEQKKSNTVCQQPSPAILLQENCDRKWSDSLDSFSKQVSKLQSKSDNSKSKNIEDHLPDSKQINARVPERSENSKLKTIKSEPKSKVQPGDNTAKKLESNKLQSSHLNKFGHVSSLLDSSTETLESSNKDRSLNDSDKQSSIRKKGKCKLSSTDKLNEISKNDSLKQKGNLDSPVKKTTSEAETNLLKKERSNSVKSKPKPVSQIAPSEVPEDLWLPGEHKISDPEQSNLKMFPNIAEASIEVQDNDVMFADDYDITFACDNITSSCDNVNVVPNFNHIKAGKFDKASDMSGDSSIKNRIAEAPKKQQKRQTDFRNFQNVKEKLATIVKLLAEDNAVIMQREIEIDKQLRHTAFLQQISSFVDICVDTGMLKLAHKFVAGCTLRGKQEFKSKKVVHMRINSLEIYHRLMQAWAKQGNFEAIQKLVYLIRDNNLSPSLQTYAISLECLGRQKNLNTEAISELVENVRKKGYRLEDIFVQYQFANEDKLFISKAVHSVLPGFKFRSNPDDNSYSCTLLDHLNADNKSFVNPYCKVFDPEKMSRQVERQLEIESMDRVMVDSVVPPPQLTPDVLSAREVLWKQKEKWRSALKQGFLDTRQHLEAYGGDTDKISLIPYMKIWNADVYTDIMLQEIDYLGQELTVYSPSNSQLYSNLGHKIYTKYIVQSRKKNRYHEKVSSIYRDYLKKLDEETLDANHRVIWKDIISNHDSDCFATVDDKWSFQVKKSLGKFLYNIILSEVKIEVGRPANSTAKNNSENKSLSEMPALYTVYRTEGVKQILEICLHPFMIRLFEDAKLQELSFNTLDMPLLTPPIPWFKYNCGGNLINTTDFIRNSYEVKLEAWIKQFPDKDLYPMFDGLNTISTCPWIINKPILDLIIQVFNQGGNAKLKIPVRPDPTEIIKINPRMTVAERNNTLHQNHLTNKLNKERHSMWCTMLYRLSIANKYRDEMIWFPHSVDFRGRTYPTPPHFNHLGDDVSRSILLFGKGKPLGPNGLNWLKIHLINLTGAKKRLPNRERLAYADENMSEILDSADNPFTGRLWWQNSEDPWQTLACCMEIAKAVRSPNPEQFISHVPVHQDGSCNGLQHYAALGRDEAGAKSVNLSPCDSPQDVYSDVVDLVEKSRQQDSSDFAKSLGGFIRRKVIKQTIMTTVYGVTAFGARGQIGGQLRRIEDFPESLVFNAQAYLAEKTFESLRQMFTSTKEIQEWFVSCAEIISNVHRQPVKWTTPIGFPIFQPYFKVHRITEKKNKKNGVTYEKPNTMKQRNSFPPNYIHSLDSTHMLLTAIHCMRSGIVYASVHDCFWTQACDVDTMNKICREQFVTLYQQPILENLAKELYEKFGFSDDEIKHESNEFKREAKKFCNAILQKVPTRGTFDIKKVLESKYFFS